MDTTAQNQPSASGVAQQGQLVTPVQNQPPVQPVQTMEQPTPPVQPVVPDPQVQTLLVQPVQTAPAQIVQPIVPGGKETPPVPVVKPQEWAQETPAEIVLPKEAQEVGVEVTPSEVIEVAPEVAEQGVAPVGTATPVPTEPTLKFPMTEEKAEGILKMHKKVKDSIYWLAMLIVRQFQILKAQKKPVVAGEVVAKNPAVQEVQPNETQTTGLKEAA